MKEKLIKGIQKTITRMVELSRQGLTEQQCLIDLSQLSFNLLSQGYIWKLQFPKGSMYHEDFMSQELSNYKTDLEAWELLQGMVMDYWQLVKLSEPFTDVMHLIGYSSQKLSKAMGQFLTPPTVAEALNRLAGNIPELETSEDILVGDFAGCGAGSLLLGWLRYAHELHATRLHQVHMVGVDLDPKMVRITALQVILSTMIHQVPFSSLRVECGNALIQDKKLFAYAIPNVRKYLSNHQPNNLDNEERDRQIERLPAMA